MLKPLGIIVRPVTVQAQIIFYHYGKDPYGFPDHGLIVSEFLQEEMVACE